MSQKTKLPHFAELDGIRGLAALAVFVCHFFLSASYEIPANCPAVFRGFVLATQNLGYGVDVFFVLSGFLITSLILIDRPKKAFLHDFYWKRILRILPVYVIHLIGIMILYPHQWGYIILSLLFIVNFEQRFHVADLGPAWSLSIEEQFYAIWPQIVRRLKLPTIYWIALSVAATSVLLRLSFYLAGLWVPVRFTPFRCDGLALGAVLACSWFSTDGLPTSLARVMRVLNSRAMLIAVLMFTIALLIARPPLEMSCVAYLVYRLLRYIVMTDWRHGVTSVSVRWLSHPVLRYMGAISYALYMFHTLMLDWVNRHYGKINLADPKSTLLRLLVETVVIIAACSVSRYAVELPVLSLRRFVLKPKPQVHAAAHS